MIIVTFVKGLLIFDDPAIDVQNLRVIFFSNTSFSTNMFLFSGELCKNIKPTLTHFLNADELSFNKVQPFCNY